MTKKYLWYIIDISQGWLDDKELTPPSDHYAKLMAR